MMSIRILIDLDSIYDTLWGTTRIASESWAEQLICADYYNRTNNLLSNVISTIDDSVITDGWISRNVNTLKHSVVSNMVQHLARYIKRTTSFDYTHPKACRVEVTVNTYPYKLSKRHKRELFTGLQEILGAWDLLEIHATSSELLPLVLARDYEQFIIADFLPWATLHTEGLVQHPMPDVTCTCPIILLPEFHDVKDTEAVAVGLKSKYMEYLDLDVVPLSLYTLMSTPK